MRLGRRDGSTVLTMGQTGGIIQALTALGSMPFIRGVKLPFWLVFKNTNQKGGPPFGCFPFSCGGGGGTSSWLALE